MPSIVFKSKNPNLGWDVKHAVQVFDSDLKTDIGLIKEIIDTCLEVYFMYEKRKWIMKY